MGMSENATIHELTGIGQHFKPVGKVRTVDIRGLKSGIKRIVIFIPGHSDCDDIGKSRFRLKYDFNSILFITGEGKFCSDISLFFRNKRIDNGAGSLFIN